jgi:hypothetical protein
VIKRLGREADHSSPFSAEIKNAWSYTSIPPVSLRDVVLSLAQHTFSWQGTLLSRGVSFPEKEAGMPNITSQRTILIVNTAPLKNLGVTM